MIEKWKNDMVAFEKSAIGFKLKKKRDNVYSRIFHKLRPKFIDQMIPTEELLSVSVLTCLARIPMDE
jgi:hypothetical protein